MARQGGNSRQACCGPLVFALVAVGAAAVYFGLQGEIFRFRVGIGTASVVRVMDGLVMDQLTADNASTAASRAPQGPDSEVAAESAGSSADTKPIDSVSDDLDASEHAARVEAVKSRSSASDGDAMEEETDVASAAPPQPSSAGQSSQAAGQKQPAADGEEDPLRPRFYYFPVKKGSKKKPRPPIPLWNWCGSEGFTGPPPPSPRDGSPQVHLFSFGKGRFEGAAMRVNLSAFGLKLFDSVHVFKEIPEHIKSNKKWKLHTTAKKASRGAGYWFWKPAITQDILHNSMQDGDVLFYMDSGADLGQAKAWGRVFDLMCKYDIITFNLGWPENMYTKGDTYQRFGVSPADKCYSTGQLSATYFLIKNSERTRQFADLWVELASDYHLISDERTSVSNGRFFRENRHDQSLFSMLVKANKPIFSKEVKAQHAKRRHWYKAGLPPRSEWKRHKHFGVEGLQVLVMEDLGFPSNLRTGPFGASRNDRFTFNNKCQHCNPDECKALKARITACVSKADDSTDSSA
eukprot:gnl/TRDRNA2_/TRDRNA2_133165_c0_seq2.p1 gnl/TRDRNA2_/TRDRNA2_133165_c0~~gnl/TRDRNA2_/TRDRNA2_133165_c0_seq2.p1  ORF type:complete len:519 (+),score=79.76 gnl/TRDRNA2_/TRDRNA2_133165_c0_seq2:19-1575(+)